MKNWIMSETQLLQRRRKELAKAVAAADKNFATIQRTHTEIVSQAREKLESLDSRLSELKRQGATKH